jgi:hypothetical protein
MHDNAEQVAQATPHGRSVTMNMKRFTPIALCAALALFGGQAFAEITLDINLPTITMDGTTGVPAIDTALTGLFAFSDTLLDDTPADDTAFEAQVRDYKTRADQELGQFKSQDSFAQGFADANVMSSQAATLNGFEGYKTFGVMLGYMIGIQLPSSDPNAIAEISDSINDDPDVYLGIANALSVNVGFNMGKVLGLVNNDLGDKAKRFYVNVHGGFINQSLDTSDSTVDMKTTTFGIGVNYQLIQPKGVVAGLFKWRGVSVGSGFTYQRNSFDTTSDLDPVSNPFSMTQDVSGQTVIVDGTLIATPGINIGVDMRTFSIPLEAVTSFQLLWLFNVHAGVGADIVFGKSDITATSSSALDAENIHATVNGIDAPVNFNVAEQGSVVVDASTTDIKPTWARARVMAGIGANMGPLKLDIPFYYYFSDGYAVGMSVGVVW